MQTNTTSYYRDGLSKNWMWGIVVGIVVLALGLIATLIAASKTPIPEPVDVEIATGHIATLSGEGGILFEPPGHYSIEISRVVDGRKVVVLPEYDFDGGFDLDGYARYRLIKSHDERVIGLREPLNYRLVFMYDIDSGAFWPPTKWKDRNLPSAEATMLLGRLRQVEPKLFGPKLMHEETIRQVEIMQRDAPEVIDRFSE